MHTRLTALLAFLFGSLSAQDYKVQFLPEVSTAGYDWSAALLPDSTMLVTSCAPQTYDGKVHHLARKGKTWEKIDSHLADLINGLLPVSEKVRIPYFRFSEDFTHVVVSIQQTPPHYGFFESRFVNGEWTHFTEIGIDPRLGIHNQLAISSDHRKLYGRSFGGRLYMFSWDGKSWSKGTLITAFDQVLRTKKKNITEVMTIGDNGLLVRIELDVSKEDQKAYEAAVGNENDKQVYFYAKQGADNKWTVPVALTDMHPLANNLALTPARDRLLFVGEDVRATTGMDIGVMPIPKLLQPELASSKVALGSPADLVVHKELGVSFLTSLNSKQLDVCIAMMPDSTVLISSYREGSCRAYQLAWENNAWVKIESKLADMINSLMPRTNSEPYFRFSDDYTHVVVTIQEEGLPRYFESKVVNGEWGLFSQIDLNPNLEIWHGIAMSADYSTLYGVAKVGGIHVFKREGDAWTEGTQFTAFEKISDGREWFMDVMTIGNDIVVANVSYQASRDEMKEFQKKYGSNDLRRGYFFTKREPGGKWTAPMLLADTHPFVDNLVTTPFGEWMLFATGEFGKIPMPKFLAPEIASARKPKSPLVREQSETTKPAIAAEPKMSEGKYYALLIGNADYKVDKLDLDKPVVDVAKLSRTLAAQYQFEQSNITTLTNVDRSSIFKALQDLRSKITRRDNVLIFYAGHGSWDQVVRQGYWWPVDAQPDNPANWLSNSDLREQISGINSAHTLLISDACFSAEYLRNEGWRNCETPASILNNYTGFVADVQLPVVPCRLCRMKALSLSTWFNFWETNEDKFLSSGELFSRMRKSVMNNGVTVPQEGVIMNTGDEGGDFIFIRR